MEIECNAEPPFELDEACRILLEAFDSGREEEEGEDGSCSEANSETEGFECRVAAGSPACRKHLGSKNSDDGPEPKYQASDVDSDECRVAAKRARKASVPEHRAFCNAILEKDHPHGGGRGSCSDDGSESADDAAGRAPSRLLKKACV